MEEFKENVLELYGEGASIEDISEELNSTYEKILDILKDYKVEQKNKGIYTEEFMKLVARRDCRGVKRNKIMSELGVSRSLLIKSVEKYGFVKTQKNPEPEEIIKKVDDSFVFTECPECNSQKINKVQTLYKGLSNIDGIYCLDCGGEFFKHHNNLFKVKWENID